MKNIREGSERLGRFVKRWKIERRARCYSETSSRDDHVRAALTWFRGSLIDGSGSSAKYSMLRQRYAEAYPETTGYWICTLSDAGKVFPASFESVFGERAVASELVDWLLSIQNPEGSFPGSYGSENSSPRVFNTGQIVLGLLSHFRDIPDDRLMESMQRAANWLVRIQSADGAWRLHSKHQLSSNTRTAWSLIDLGMLTGRSEYVAAGVANVEFALALQSDHGYFRSNGFNDEAFAFTHTIAYAIRGVLEAGLLLERPAWLDRARLAYDAVVGMVHSNGFLPGRIAEDLSADSSFVCLTGNCQLSIIGFILAGMTGDSTCHRSASKLLEFVRRKQLRSDRPGIDGGIPGSWPIRGRYNAFEIPNWGVKFFVDALIAEHRLKT